MRQRSFHRPKEKLRGTRRRLKALDKWADSFENYFPTDRAAEKYCNWKIPVLDRLVCPPTTTPELQTYCISALLRAAKFLVSARPVELHYAKVSVLITYPDMFGSEICIFFDQAYFYDFFNRNSDSESLEKVRGGSLSSKLAFETPKGFVEIGHLYTTKDECDGEIVEHKEQWWSYHD